FFQAEDGIRDFHVTGVQTCALPICTVIGAAKLLEIHEQTAKNLLHTARLRAGATTTLALARLYAKELPSPAVLRRKAKARSRRRSEERRVGKERRVWRSRDATKNSK